MCVCVSIWITLNEHREWYASRRTHVSCYCTQYETFICAIIKRKSDCNLLCFISTATNVQNIKFISTNDSVFPIL